MILSQPVEWPSTPRLDGGEQAQALVLLAHGAGAGMDHPFMAEMAAALASPAVLVIRFEFDYMVAARALDKRRPPDRLPKLTDCFMRWIAAAKANYPHLPLFLAGKSMGGRVACVCASSEHQTGIDGVFALGYPFHPVGKTAPEQWRWQPLQQAQVPVTIIQGCRDSFGNQPQLTEQWPEQNLPESLQLHWLEDGDHSFVPRKSSGLTQQQHIATAATLITSKLGLANSPATP